MTMLGFRVPAADARAAQRWAERRGLDRSELLRRALQAHLAQLAAEEDAAAWERAPLTDAEPAFTTIADWGPAEDWEGWADAAR